MSGQIVLISGSSGAGKTTTCSTFARRADQAYLMFGMDLLVGTLFPGKYTIFGDKKDEGYYGTGWGPVGADPAGLYLAYGGCPRVVRQFEALSPSPREARHRA
jgi:hypothetical protein